MSELSTKPYLIRAIYEWCADATLTPYLNVKVDQNVRVPMEYVKNGEIVLSVSQQATRNLTIGNDLIQFSARFNGVSREISIPIYAVQAIFARENGRGVFFEPEAPPENFSESAAAPRTSPLRAVQPRLTAVDTGSANAIEASDALDAGLDAAPATVSVLASVTPLAPGAEVLETTPIEPFGPTLDPPPEGDPPNPPHAPKGPAAPPRGNLRVIK
jgi:stringent starvation protein B